MRTRAFGFTLLEMLLVVVILAALAAAAMTVVDQVDLQGRYDDTKNRVQSIREAIVGQPGRTVNGAPDLAGFVSDMGRLPRHLDELTNGLSPTFVTDALDPSVTLAGMAGLPAGWRGPYLRFSSTDGSFPDGWGHASALPDYGWYVAPFPAPSSPTYVAGPGPSAGAGPSACFVVPSDTTFIASFTLTSLGSELSNTDPNLVADSTPGALTWDEIPYPGVASPLVSTDDYLVYPGTVSVTLQSATQATLASCALRIFYPDPTVPAGGTPVLAGLNSMTRTNVSFPNGPTTVVTFTFAAGSWVPVGARAVAVVWGATPPPNPQGSSDPNDPIEPGAVLPPAVPVNQAIPVVIAPRSSLSLPSVTWYVP